MTETTSPRRHVFLISYGRTGSTLLMALLSNHPGVLVRGENDMMLRHIQRAYNSVRERQRDAASSTSDSWFGAHLFTDEYLVPTFRGFLENFMVGDRNLDEISVLGFKEAHYDGKIYGLDGKALRDKKGVLMFDESLVVADLEFLRKLFPDCLFVFNTRDPSEVVHSDFQIGRRVERFAGLNLRYQAWAAEYDGVVVDYSDIVEFGPQMQTMFDRLGITPDPEIISNTLSNLQGYVSPAEGSQISRIPYFVRVLRREDVAFWDVQSITLYETRIATISGGLIASRPVGVADWFVSDPRARIVNFKGGNPSEYYAEHMSKPEYLSCNFALEVLLPPGVESVTVSLFGQPALKVQHIEALPEAPVPT